MSCSVQQGQQLIDSGNYSGAVDVFTCVINNDPTNVEGYRGRAEARLLQNRYADAQNDYSKMQAFVLGNVQKLVLDGYGDRLALNNNDIPSLTGESFANWVFFNYAQAIRSLKTLLSIQSNNLYATLFLGSTRLLSHKETTKGINNIDDALAMAPLSNGSVHWIVADAYTYGLPDVSRAISEANLALTYNVNIPRIRSILSNNYILQGNVSGGASEMNAHFNLIPTYLGTSSTITSAPLYFGGTINIGLVAGRVINIPLPLTAGEPVTIKTSSTDFYDTILVLLNPSGTPILSSDDETKYFAGFTFTPTVTSNFYVLKVTSFEGINTGNLTITRT